VACVEGIQEYLIMVQGKLGLSKNSAQNYIFPIEKISIYYNFFRASYTIGGKETQMIV
jgi:archaellum component FlaF (FlaF/FlaG flagellin family)